MLKWCVFSEVSKELLSRDVSPKCRAKYIFLRLVNKLGVVIGRSFHFLYFNASQMTVNVIYGLFLPWRCKLKTNDIFCFSFRYLRNHLGSQQKCIKWIPRVLARQANTIFIIYLQHRYIILSDYFGPPCKLSNHDFKQYREPTFLI